VLESDMTEQQRIIRDSARRIAEEHFKPRAAKADRDYKPPLENLKVLAENGFTGICIPEEYGGAGLGVFDTTLIIEQVARCCANTAILMGTADGATARTLVKLGTEAQKKKYLPRMAKGELFAAWSMSEPNAGSDVGNVQTSAVKDGSEYVVNGSKLWCSCAEIADMFLVLVRLDPAPGMRGLGALLIERDTPGFSVGKHLDLLGLRATGMAPLYFQDCRVPAGNLIIPLGQMRKLFEVLEDDRICGNPPVCLGIAEAAMQDALAYMRERKQFGKSLTDFQGLQWKLADMAIEVEAGRALLYNAARHADSRSGHALDASITKTYINEMSVRVTNAAIQLCGTYGLSEEFPFERYFRDVRGLSIGYGSTEIHRNTIAGAMIGGRYSV